MPLPVPVEEHSRLRDVLLCLALGNLCFVQRWFDLEILQVRDLDFYRSAPSDRGLLIATLISSSIPGTRVLAPCPVGFEEQTTHGSKQSLAAPRFWLCSTRSRASGATGILRVWIDPLEHNQ